MVCLYTSWFSRQYNEWYGLDGPLFRGPYGIASKVTDQKIRDAIAYLYNNPVERQLCKRAEQAHWNFLAYAENPYPFSQPIRLDKARAPMRRAVEEVRATRKEDRPLEGVDAIDHRFFALNGSGNGFLDVLHVSNEPFAFRVPNVILT